MSHYAFTFCGATLHALPSGALYWPDRSLLCVSDLHFGKAQRYAARGGAALPPYETRDTLMRLDADITGVAAKTVICLGDSFDRIGALDDLEEEARDWITRLQAGRRWIWIEGNHDPGPIGIGGTHLAELQLEALTFRHIADPSATGEVSGHYHPKIALPLKGRRVTRSCFVKDARRLILPAYGTYTGGMSVRSDPLAGLFSDDAICILTGTQAQPVPR